jgi:hypothetical protein
MLLLVVGIIVIVAAAYEFVPIAIGCGIKGNISIRTGEHIYHLPGQKYYFSTRIDPFRGERWFCSEPETRAAGWQKSRI